MIDHLSTYATDFDATRAFYAAALGALGYTVQSEFVASWDTEFPERRCCAFGSERPVFWVIEVKPVNKATPRHTAFTAADRDTVTAFYDAAIAAGGKDNGGPGLRAEYHPDYFGAFVLDPDSNNVEAVCHTPPN